MQSAARLLAPLRLMRPANALTAAADALAGITVAWGLAPGDIAPRFWFLPLAAFLLYAGGVALNDVCDADLDRRDRPGRPIPQGHIPRRHALLLAAALLAAGVFCAGLYSSGAGLLALALTALIAYYDVHAKHRAWLGPLALGLCRAGSLLLGMAASADGIAQGWPLASIPVGYVFAVTLIGRGESDGKNPLGLAALGMVVLVAVAYGYLAVIRGEWPALAFVGLSVALAWPAFVRAAEEPSPDSIRAAVQAGVLNLVIGDATLAAAFAGPLAGLSILLLLPVSRGLSRVFPVA